MKITHLLVELLAIKTTGCTTEADIQALKGVTAHSAEGE